MSNLLCTVIENTIITKRLNSNYICMIQLSGLILNQAFFIQLVNGCVAELANKEIKYHNLK